MPLEKKLYNRIEKFAEMEFGCRLVKNQVGTNLGTVDILGIRDIPSDLGAESELIAIEVKEEGATFLKAVGQTKAYSIYANKCYLAVRKRYSNQFSFEEIDIANQMGIGLIEIKTTEIKVLATSATYRPLERYSLQIIDRMKLFRCTICGALYERTRIQNINRHGKINIREDENYKGTFVRAIRNNMNARYWLYEHAEKFSDDGRTLNYNRRIICKDCVSIFASLATESVPKIESRIKKNGK